MRKIYFETHIAQILRTYSIYQKGFANGLPKSGMKSFRGKFFSVKRPKKSQKTKLIS